MPRAKPFQPIGGVLMNALSDIMTCVPWFQLPKDETKASLLFRHPTERGVQDPYLQAFLGNGYAQAPEIRKPEGASGHPSPWKIWGALQCAKTDAKGDVPRKKILRFSDLPTPDQVAHFPFHRKLQVCERMFQVVRDYYAHFDRVFHECHEKYKKSEQSRGPLYTKEDMANDIDGWGSHWLKWQFAMRGAWEAETMEEHGYLLIVYTSSWVQRINGFLTDHISSILTREGVAKACEYWAREQARKMQFSLYEQPICEERKIRGEGVKKELMERVVSLLVDQANHRY